MTAVVESGFINPVKQSLWECPMWHYKTHFTDDFNKELLKELYKIAYNFNEDDGKESLLDCDQPCIKELVDFKTNLITTTVASQCLIKTQEVIVTPTKSWVNVNIAGEGIELHAHPDASIACTYYIQAPDAGGDFYYVDTGRVGEHKTEVKTITPETGDIIFFPAYVLHGVETNKGKARVNLTTSFTHKFTEKSKSRFTLKNYINSMLRIKDL